MENTATVSIASVSAATNSAATISVASGPPGLETANQQLLPAHPAVESRISPGSVGLIVGESRPRRQRHAIERAAVFDASDVMPMENRLRLIALHVPWYGFRTQSRLARDSGISRASVSRLVRYRSQPSLWVALRLTRALSIRLGRPLDVWEVFSLDGTYPTASVCGLCGCRSCSLGSKASVRERKGGA